MNSSQKENCSSNNESYSNIDINIFNKINNIYEENKTNDLCINTNKKDQSTQTELNPLYIEEEDIPNITKELKEDKKRKDSPDLIRDKIFKYFNKMIFNWILNTKGQKDEIDIISYQFEKNNKQCISESMNKCLKELFIPKNQIEKLKNINNELLKYKLDFNYKKIYEIFICEPNQIKPDNYLDNFLDNFKILEDFLESLKGKENKKYIKKVKDIALTYEKWKDKKMHFSS